MRNKGKTRLGSLSYAMYGFNRLLNETSIQTVSADASSRFALYSNPAERRGTRPQPHPAGNVTMAILERSLLLTAFQILVAMNSFASSSAPARIVVAIVETTADKQKLLQSQPDLAFERGEETPGFAIRINEDVKYQQMDGFGASLTDSSAWVVWNKLNASQRQDLWRELFSASDGIGINLLRQPMGASDFSASGNYSYDDVPTGQADTDQAHFSTAHDEPYIIPLLKQALSVNPGIKIVALPWSAPAWMKTSGTMNGGNLKSEYFPSLAKYFVKFVQGYQLHGVPIYAISVQNEPLYSTDTYPTEYLPAAEEAAFIGTHLGPAMRSAGFDGVKIFGYDHNWNKPEYPEAVLSDAAANRYVAGSAFHCYAGSVEAQSAVRKMFPAKDIWFTECSGITPTSFAKDLSGQVENLLIGAIRNWARSVVLWNIVLDQNSGPTNGGCMNCRAVVTVDSSKPTPSITRNVEYYVLGHLAKFVQPGAFRIDSNSFGYGNIQDVAFQNPNGSIVLLVMNGGSAGTAFTVHWHEKAFRCTLQAGAVATFRWQETKQNGK
jgi:glucosylceramidase